MTLFSGKRVFLEAALNEPLESLKKRAQKTLGVGRGRLLDASGSIRDGASTLAAAGSREGDCLTLQIGDVQVSGGYCFATILGDGFVVTWGAAAFAESAVMCKTN